MPVIAERARAKINLTLKVLGKRSDGYHEIESLVAFAGEADTLTLDLDKPLSVSAGGPFGASIAGENLVRVTLDRLAQAEPRLRLGAVTLHKNLPIAAGVGGGSSDAAAVLRAVQAANPEFATSVDWLAIATVLGADVPVCFHNRAAIIRGIGERLQFIDDVPSLAVVLLNPQVAVPADKTAQVFRSLAVRPFDPNNHQPELSLSKNRGELLAFMAATGNDLSAPAARVVAELELVIDTLSKCQGAEHIAVSGGGPTCFAVFPDDARATAAALKLSAAHPAWWVRATRLSG